MLRSSSSHIDISALRERLSRWYDGSLPQVEEEQLIQAFSSIPASELPADLAEERMIFASMAAPQVSEAEAEAAIDRAIRSVERKKRSHFRHRLMWGAAAACVCAALATIGLTLWHGEPQSVNTAALRTVSAPAVPAVTSPEESVTAPVRTIDVTSQTKPVAKAKRATKSALSQDVSATPVSAASGVELYGYREPTPEEAEAILLALSHTGGEIRSSAEEVSDCVDSALDTLREETENAAEYSEYVELFYLLHNDDN